ncbi:sugar phosphate isomerase/epimerase family protein [Armatimonas rosea]|uniref:Sugar phosphate isomerase/epimerase n=1 Tax=Armatimonas rosea TaxID=685828 RepID=A0A7W9SWX8_ARMRO|nr:sugar phosphate isomerase/epimerase [Armatimonas rosea]MBB6053503.1 sugar phosphate isomerase/epimerase [Armatimonas rosea]
MAKIPICLQMYTVRDDAQRDLAGTLATVASLGYAGVELAGYSGKTAQEYKALLDSHGLRAIGAHVGVDQVTGKIDQTIEEAKLFGYNYVIVPWIGKPYTESLEGYRTLGAELSAVAEQYTAAGLTLCYHNHAFEFDLLEGDKTGLDVLFESAPRVQAELDTFWIKKGCQDIPEYLTRLSGRVPLVHLKDMDAEGNFAPVGTGTVDYPALFAAAEAAGVAYYMVEQDSCQAPLTPLESIKVSMENLKAWGKV